MSLEYTYTFISDYYLKAKWRTNMYLLLYKVWWFFFVYNAVLYTNTFPVLPSFMSPHLGQTAHVGLQL